MRVANPQERLRQKKEYDIVINERDILGTQLIRRNDELALLYEKIKIQQSTLNKGQIQYRDRLNEIRVLKIKLNDLKRELHILKNSVANIDVLKVCSRLHALLSCPDRCAPPVQLGWADVRPVRCDRPRRGRCTTSAASCCRSAPRSRPSARSWRTP